MSGLKDMTFRVLVVALLLLIWLELGGGERLNRWFWYAVYEVEDSWPRREMPAPPSPGQRDGGLSDAYQAETEEALRDLALRQAQPPSAPKP